MNRIYVASELIRQVKEIESLTTQLIAQRDDARAALRTIRAGITEATAYPETVAWVRRVIDAVLSQNP